MHKSGKMQRRNSKIMKPGQTGSRDTNNNIETSVGKM